MRVKKPFPLLKDSFCSFLAPTWNVQNLLSSYFLPVIIIDAHITRTRGLQFSYGKIKKKILEKSVCAPPVTFSNSLLDQNHDICSAFV